MSNSRTIIALGIVLLILAAGIAGWALNSEMLQLTFFLGAILLIVILATVGRVQSLSSVLKVLYSRKEFDRIQSKGKNWTLETYRRFHFGYGVVALLTGMGLLYAYSVSGFITALLWGIGFVPSGLSALMLGCIFKESDLHSPHTKRVTEYSRIFLMTAPFIVFGGMYFLPASSVLQGEYVMLNVFGILIAIIGLANLPFALWKVASALSRA